MSTFPGRKSSSQHRDASPTTWNCIRQPISTTRLAMVQHQDNPTIPILEYPQRWAKAQAMMAEHDLDVLVAYADDRATFGAAHARWFANFPVHFEPACVLLPRQGAPLLLVGPESDQ